MNGCRRYTATCNCTTTNCVQFWSGLGGTGTVLASATGPITVTVTCENRAADALPLSASYTVNTGTVVTVGPLTSITCG